MIWTSSYIERKSGEFTVSEINFFWLFLTDQMIIEKSFRFFIICTVKLSLFVSISERVWIFKEQDPPRNTKADFLTFAFSVVGLLMGIPVPHTLSNFRTFYNPDTDQKCIGIILASNRMLGAALSCTLPFGVVFIVFLIITSCVVKDRKKKTEVR